MERKKRIRRGLPPELEAQYAETQRLLAERIAYHRTKIEEERARRERRGAWRRKLVTLFSRS